MPTSQALLSGDLSTVLLIIIYGLASIVGVAGMLLQKQRLSRAGSWLACIAFAFQTLTLLLGFHSTFVNGLSGGAYLQLLAWFISAAGLLLWILVKQNTAILFAAPFCLTLFVMSLPYLSISLVIPAKLSASFYVLHIACIFASMALTAIAFIDSCLFLVTERTIKNKRKVKGFLLELPSLQLLDSINKICLLIAFPLYTIGIVTGLLRAKPTFGMTFNGDPKEIMSILIWIIFAFLFHNRLAKNWTGKKPAICMVVIFLLSLFSLLVINTLMPSHHAFVH